MSTPASNLELVNYSSGAINGYYRNHHFITNSSKAHFIVSAAFVVIYCHFQ